MSSDLLLEGPTSILANPLTHVLFAGLCFGGCEVLLSHGPPKSWLQSLFKRNDRLKTRLDDTVRSAVGRIVGAVHVLIQVPLAIYIMLSPEMAANRIYSNSGISFWLTTTSAGYFLYDLYICIFRFEGAAYLMHGAFCFTLYTYTALSGFLHYYAAMFLMWELSTPCVYVRWFLYNTGNHDTTAYIVNGLTMLATFFCCRNVLGLFMSINFFKDSQAELSAPHQKTGGMPPAMLWVYRVANVLMNSLNAMWFYKMARGALKVLGTQHKDKHHRSQSVTECEETNRG